MPKDSRLINRAELRRYMGNMAWDDVTDRIAKGRIPPPLYRVPPDSQKALWDRKAVDRALDAESAVPASIEAAERELDRAFGLA